ncbi:MAG: DUF6497 family protein [Halocynthiibacter sp.]
MQNVMKNQRITMGDVAKRSYRPSLRGVVFVAAVWSMGVMGGVRAMHAMSYFSAPEFAAPAAPQDVALKDGRVVAFYEQVNKPEDGMTHFRFVDQRLAFGEVAYELVADDFFALCNGFALAHLSSGGMPEQVVIALSGAPTEFGKNRPDVVQLFEAFEVKNGNCERGVF